MVYKKGTPEYKEWIVTDRGVKWKKSTGHPKGIPLSTNHRRSISLAQLGKPHPHKKHSDISKQRISDGLKRSYSDGVRIGFAGTGFKGRTHTDDTRAKIRIARAQQVITEEHKMAISRGISRKYNTDIEYWRKSVDKWKDPEYRAKYRASMNLKPNRPESALIEFVEKYDIPFKYTGDFERPVSNGDTVKFPDFVHDVEDIVIEVVGDAFHDANVHKDVYGVELPYHRTVDGMIEFYASKGIGCLCIPEKKCYDEQWLKEAFAVYLE
ncbi:MAG: hypothetical protein LUQ42_05640 [Methanomicrobiales archaeon]|jgi:hypothetical protein|nr:hypothetical protein [Methanomicrobiales archaeon]